MCHVHVNYCVLHAGKHATRPLESEQCMGDIIHPRAATYSAVAAQTEEGATAKHEKEKIYRDYEVGNCCFVSLTVETHAPEAGQALLVHQERRGECHPAWQQQHLCSHAAHHWHALKAVLLFVRCIYQYVSEERVPHGVSTRHEGVIRVLNRPLAGMLSV
jgi:hypothetical protein